MIERIALKPCPFCGSAHASVWMEQRVICNLCGAEGPDSGEDEETLADRIAAWNTRTAELSAGDGVQQVDREAAASLLEAEPSRKYAPINAKLGHMDDLPTVQAFFRHRSTAAAAERARIVAWLRGKAEEANSHGLHDDYVAADAFVEAADAIKAGEV